jgi:hypothetical protein
MQPLGRKPSRFPTKTDCHPPKGYVNWWENEMSTPANKAAAKRDAELEIKKEMEEDDAED